MENTCDRPFFEKYKVDWIVSILLSIAICVVYFVFRVPGDLSSLVKAYGPLLSVCGFGYITGHDSFKYPPATAGIAIYLFTIIVNW